jgi:CheY-like chemotaxis protein
MHGGSVTAHSDGLGKGAEFTVRIPVARPRALLRADVAAASAPPRPGSLKVLVVDDNVDAAETLGQMLETFGCDARVANDGPQALIAARHFHPELVLLDIGLPVMDGYEVAERLRALPGLQALRIVAVTGYGQRADQERSREAGFAEHLIKPLAPARLREVLDQTRPAQQCLQIDP